MKDKMHNSKAFKLNFSEDSEPIVNNKRKLEFSTFKSNTPYTQRSGGRDESHVNISLSYLNNNFEKIIDELYDVIKQLQTMDYSFIYSRLEELRQATLSLMEGSVK